MRRILTTILLTAATVAAASAQIFNKVESLDEAPAGVVVYSLPSTTIHLSVEAVCESYTPGIYAKFAKKYLGIDVPQTASESCELRNIKMTPYIEADRESNYILDLSGVAKNAAPLSFLHFTSQGLVILSDEHKGNSTFWRFPALNENAGQINTAATDNLTTTETTLYQSVKNAQGTYETVAISQSQVVEKNAERKAQEVAELIFSLREQRLNIITGNTDATFSGDALRAAVEEINRLEQEYMKLFIGNVTVSSSRMDFDIVPQTGSESEMTVAFRLSDAGGLVSSDDLSGRPIVIEITPEVSDEAQEPTIIKKEGKKKSKEDLGSIFYRIPAICNVKVTDGQDILLQSRVPVYQKGHTLTFPADVIVR